MAAQVVLYAEQMKVPERIVDDMMAIPADQLRYLTPADLAVVSTDEERSPLWTMFDSHADSQAGGRGRTGWTH